MPSPEVHPLHCLLTDKIGGTPEHSRAAFSVNNFLHKTLQTQAVDFSQKVNTWRCKVAKKWKRGTSHALYKHVVQ